MRRILCAILFAATAGCADDTDDRPLDFDYIHAAIILPRCANVGCHSDLTRKAGFSLQDRDAAEEFFAKSINTDILRGKQPDRPRMPPDQPLPAADIDLIQRWKDAQGSGLAGGAP